jgi:hypothetical protein
MGSIKTGGPAYPMPEYLVNLVNDKKDLKDNAETMDLIASMFGKSWLDECAMRAMQSVLIKDDGALIDMAEEHGITPSEAVAKTAYSFAKAMLAEKQRLEAKKDETHGPD